MKKNIDHQLISNVVVQRLQQKFSTHVDYMTIETDKFFLWVIQLFMNRIEDEEAPPERYLRFNFSISHMNEEVLCVECDETKSCFLSNKKLIHEEFILIIKDVVNIFNSLPQYRAVYREKEDIHKSKLIIILGI